LVGDTSPPPFLSLDVVKSFGGFQAYEEYVAEELAALREERVRPERV
jgi:hypothetical protein